MAARRLVGTTAVVIAVLAALYITLHTQRLPGPVDTSCTVALYSADDTSPTTYGSRLMLLLAAAALQHSPCVDMYVYRSRHSCTRGRCLRDLVKALGVAPHVPAAALRLKLVPDNFELPLLQQYDIFIMVGGPSDMVPRHPAGAGTTNVFVWQHYTGGWTAAPPDAAGEARLLGYDHVVLGSEHRYARFAALLADVYLRHTEAATLLPTPHVVKLPYIRPPPPRRPRKQRPRKNAQRQEQKGAVVFDDDRPSADLQNSYDASQGPPADVVVLVCHGVTRRRGANHADDSAPSPSAAAVAALRRYYASAAEAGRARPALALTVVLPSPAQVRKPHHPLTLPRSPTSLPHRPSTGAAGRVASAGNGPHHGAVGAGQLHLHH